MEEAPGRKMPGRKMRALASVRFRFPFREADHAIFCVDGTLGLPYFFDSAVV